MQSASSSEHTNGESTMYMPGSEAFAKTADQLRRADEQLVAWVKERPLAAVGLALGAGYLLGRLLSRWG